MQQLLDAMPDVSAYVRNGRLDVLASNVLARALYADAFDSACRNRDDAPNLARFTFLDPRAPELFPEWNRVTADTVATLRAETGRNPEDRLLNELIGELTSRSEQFSSLWATHNVRSHTTGAKRLCHRLAGDMTLDYEGLDLPADPGQTLITFLAAPGSPSHQALAFLGSWARSPEHAAAPEGKQP